MLNDRWSQGDIFKCIHFLLHVKLTRLRGEHGTQKQNTLPLPYLLPSICLKRHKKDDRAERGDFFALLSSSKFLHSKSAYAWPNLRITGLAM